MNPRVGGWVGWDTGQAGVGVGVEVGMGTGIGDVGEELRHPLSSMSRMHAWSPVSGEAMKGGLDPQSIHGAGTTL